MIKEKYNLEQEETLWRNREDATRLEFVEEKTGGPGCLRMNNDITLAHDGLGQGRYDNRQRWEVGQTHSSLTELYDSDSVSMNALKIHSFIFLTNFWIKT